MAILVESSSVILRIDAIDEVYPGGWACLQAECPQAMLCTDGELAGVGFTDLGEARNFVSSLISYGIRESRAGKAGDMVVVDWRHGPATPCDWAEFRWAAVNGNDHKRVITCRLKGSRSVDVSVPEDWKYDESSGIELANREVEWVGTAVVLSLDCSSQPDDVPPEVWPNFLASAAFLALLSLIAPPVLFGFAMLTGNGFLILGAISVLAIGMVTGFALACVLAVVALIRSDWNDRRALALAGACALIVIVMAVCCSDLWRAGVGLFR